MKTIIELREEAIEKDINPECYLYQKLEKQQQILDKIKEYCNNRLQYYNEMERDYDKYEFDYAENDNENILELLEEIE
jgi:hypothetical protein